MGAASSSSSLFGAVLVGNVALLFLLAATTMLALMSSRFRSFALGLLRFFGSAFLITFESAVCERVLGGFPLLSFPRSQAEIASNPSKLFELLKTKRGSSNSSAVDASDVFLSASPLADIESEPDKKATAGSWALTYSHSRDGDERGEKETRTINVFVKFQCGRHLPLWLQCARAALEPGVVREVDFYNTLADAVPILTPKVFFAGKIPSLNRVCCVLEHYDLSGQGEARVIPDWKPCEMRNIESMTTSIASMHAAFYGKTRGHPLTSWIPARKGLEYASFVPGLIKDEPEWFQGLWTCLEKHFANHPLTLVHGDCRPGNMIFLASGKTVFSDFEAVNVAPLAWDFTYMSILGLEPSVRREHSARLLSLYRDSLLEHPDPAAAIPSLDTLANDSRMLTIVLYYVSFVVEKYQFWKSQGNTTQDKRAWSARVGIGVQDLNDAQMRGLLGETGASYLGLLKKRVEAALAQE